MKYFLIMVFFLMSFPVQAQDDSEWFVILMNEPTGELLRVYADSTQESFNINLDVNYYRNVDIPFSSDGRFFAFCYVPHIIDAPYARLIVRDIAAEENILDLDLGFSVRCRANRFDASDSTVAVSVIHHDIVGSGIAEPSWKLVIVNLQNGQVTYQIDANSPETDSFSSMPDIALFPEIRYFRDNQLIVVATPNGIGGDVEFPAYLWNLTDNSLTPVANWGKSGVDILHEEMIYLDYNPDLPESTVPMMVNSNALVYSTTETGDVVVYQSAPEAMLNSLFINEGRQIAVEITNTQGDDWTTRWIAIDRDGNVVELINNTENYSQIIPAPDGYALLINDGTTYTLSLHNDDQTIEIWSSPAENAYWEIVYAPPIVPAEGLPAFTPVQ